MFYVKNQCSQGSYLLILPTFSWQAHSCQISFSPHMMPTPTHHLQTSFFLRTEALFSLPKSPHSPLLWNEIPDLTHVLLSLPLFCWRCYYPLCSSAQIQTENVHITWTCVMHSVSHQILWYFPSPPVPCCCCLVAKPCLTLLWPHGL